MAMMQKATEAGWLASAIGDICERFEHRAPSVMAEAIRFMPQSVTNTPGPFRFDVAPYTREIVDCFAVDSPIRIVAVKKGVQVAFTVGVLENVILYFIEQIRTSPVLFVTADSELAELRMATNVVPMIQNSGVEDRIQSSDRLSAKKQGKTGLKMEWIGGGFLFPIGARNPSKMRSLPFPVALCDEVDDWPLTTRDGKPFELVLGRTKTFEDTKKVLVGSTPRDKGTSIVDEQFKLGDQRRWFFKCLGCGEYQHARWERTNEQGDKIGGIFFSMVDGKVDRDSVHYVCHHCGYAHKEEDKQIIFSPKHGAEWRPTAKPITPDRRSYHIPALISMVQSWYQCCLDFVAATGPGLDPTAPEDLEKLKVFYNNILGEPFEPKGLRPSIEQVLGHRRMEYTMGIVPIAYAKEVTGSEGMVLVTTVDIGVSPGCLHVATWGWTPGLRVFLVDYQTFDGDPSIENDPGTWGRLSELLENKRYLTDTGEEMAVSIAAIDSGTMTSQAYSFCELYDGSPIYPIKGRNEPVKGATMPFAPFKTQRLNRGYWLVVDHYKEQWAPALRKQWSGGTTQPQTFFSAPADISDDALKELTREYKRPAVSKPGQALKRKAFEWYRPHGSKNELWDLLIYSRGVLDVACYDTCTEVLGLEGQDWSQFWKFVGEMQSS